MAGAPAEKSRMRWGPCASSRFSIRQRWNVRLFSGKTWKATSGASSENDARRSACATTPRRIGTRTRTDASHPIGSEVTTAKRRSMGARGRCVDLSPSRFVDRHGEATCFTLADRGLARRRIKQDESGKIASAPRRSMTCTVRRSGNGCATVCGRSECCGRAATRCARVAHRRCGETVPRSW